MASGILVKLAKQAATASAKAGIANRVWRDAFESEYGHADISDVLVEVIDYSTGSTSMLTAKFIAEHSKPGRS